MDAPFQKLLLNYLRSCRNDMVHQGEDSSRNEELVYELKSFVDELLRLMLVTTKHLRNFDEFIKSLELPKDDNEIRLRMRLLRLATRRKRET